MCNKPHLLMVNLAQYGQHTDSYKYCQYLHPHYKITYLCLDQGFPKIEDQTQVHYLPKYSSSIKNVLQTIKATRQKIQDLQPDLIYLFYFKLCSMIQLFLPSNFILDIRTGAVDKERFKRWRLNTMIRLESYRFKQITIISQSLREDLKIPLHKSHLLPLGADRLCDKPKSYQHLSLFYIGTLSGRNLHQTIQGLALFLERFPQKRSVIHYDIFGDGFQEDQERLQKSIQKYQLHPIVSYHGRKAHHEIQSYFEQCNVGISHVPITPFYDPQPPTKTFEYLNAGMITLATNTREHRHIINAENGILYHDTPEGFSEALEELYRRRTQFDTTQILKSVSGYHWKDIVQDHLYPLLEQVRQGAKR